MDFKNKLKNFWRMNAQSAKGFTLVELIVVIAILAILAGVAVPAYSGYVEKANKAADEQLLANVNTAFAAACIENQVDPSDLLDGSVTLLPGGKSPIEGVSKYNEEFCVYFEGNLGEKFNVIDAVFVNGEFTALSGDMQSLLNTLREQYGTQAAALLNSGFSAIGYDKLANQIENASVMLGDLAGNFPESGFGMLIGSGDNIIKLVEYAGGEEKLLKLLEAKKAQLMADPKYANEPDIDFDKLAEGHLLANSAVLTAASQKDAISTEFINSLKTGNAVEMLRTNAHGGNADGTTVAQAAYSYAMYTSYLQYAGKEVPTEVNIDDVYDTLASDDFKNNYMSSSDYTADHAGYLGAMDIISGSASNAGQNTANDILLNGFNNAELVGLLQNLTK